MRALFLLLVLARAASAGEFDDWDALFGANPAATEAARRSAPGAAAARAYIRAQLASTSFYDAVLPSLFRALTRNGNFAPVSQHLRRDEEHGSFYLDKPCRADDTVEVAPWWDLAHPVRVCRDAYKPDVKYDARHGFFCEASVAPDGVRECGCGPNLMYCARGGLMLDKLRKAHAEQTLATFRHVVQNHQRFSTVLTAPFSVRSPATELFYARARYWETGKLELPPFSDGAAVVRPYDKNFAAGVLGTPTFLYYDPSPRHTLYILLDDFLCHEMRSTNVVAQQMFDVAHPGGSRTRDQSELAGKVGCRSCHATLENGLKAFWQLGGLWYASHKLPERVAATTRFYLRDQNDLRAEGPATLAWLGATMAAQPEFRACMVKKVEQLIYGGYPVPPEVHQRVAARFTSDEDMAALIEDVFVARLTARATAVAVSPAVDLPIGKLIDDHCSACHDGDGAPVRISGAAPLDARLAIRAALMVAAERMPKDHHLDPSVRTAFLRGLCGMVPEPAKCLATMTEPPPETFAKSPASLLRRFGESPAPLGELFRADNARKADNAQLRTSPLTPTMFLMSAAMALEQCKTASDVRACVRRILDVHFPRPDAH
jgi:hypothetical protein